MADFQKEDRIMTTTEEAGKILTLFPELQEALILFDSGETEILPFRLFTHEITDDGSLFE